MLYELHLVYRTHLSTKMELFSHPYKGIYTKYFALNNVFHSLRCIFFYYVMQFAFNTLSPCNRVIVKKYALLVENSGF